MRGARGNARGTGTGAIVGRSYLTPLQHNPFTFNDGTRVQHIGSASYASNSNTEGDVIDVEMVSGVDNSAITTSNAARHNCARDFREKPGFHPLKLKDPIVCAYCRATLFQDEKKKSFCCKEGKISVPEIPVPVELHNLFKNQSAEGRIFHQNIRSYNHVFAFISMGVRLDNRVATGLQGAYAFRDHGSIYHRLTIYNSHNIASRSNISADDELEEADNRDLIVQTTGDRLMNIKEFSGYYDPLQYPLFFPYGTYGWDIQSRTSHDVRITCCDYYSFMFQIRRNNLSILLYGGRLLQQYAVDNYVKIETQKLRYIGNNQEKLRAELYQGLQDCLNAGENEAANVGRRTILPSSFIGSPKDMYRRYQDAMALVQKFGKPDLFITMTCNPK